MVAIVSLTAHSRRQGATSAPQPLHGRATEPVFDPLAGLLAETARGDERSFARLYELTGGRLLAAARGIVGHADVAEDVLQEAFIRVWRSAHLYDPAKGQVQAWLVTIVRNRALTWKSAQRKHDHRRAELNAETMAFDGPDAADHMMRSEAARGVKACLENLTANHRRAVALVYFEGLTHQELAQRLQVQIGTAKSWVRRGLAQMGRCLTGHDSADWRELVAAEYAIGSLQGMARRGFERRRERDARYCGVTDRWERQLALLVEYLPDRGAAPARVWRRIEGGIGRRGTVRRSTATRGAIVAAAAILLAIVFLLR